MSDTPGGDDWVVASDYRWYPPEQMAATGWTLGEDGKWYAPPDDDPTNDAGVADPPPPSTPPVFGPTPAGAVARSHRWTPSMAGWQFWLAVGASAVFFVAAVVLFGVLAGVVSDKDDEIAALTEQRDTARAEITAAESTAEGQIAAAQDEADQTVAEAQDHLDERAARLDDRKAQLDDREAAIADSEAEIEGRAAYLEELIGNAEASQFTDGILLVGSDIQPGRYRNDGGGFCYWARLSGVSGEFGDIITNNNVQGQSVVDIASTDVAFESSGCGTWTKVG